MDYLLNFHKNSSLDCLFLPLISHKLEDFFNCSGLLAPHWPARKKPAPLPPPCADAQPASSGVVGADGVQSCSTEGHPNSSISTSFLCLGFIFSRRVCINLLEGRGDSGHNPGASIPRSQVKMPHFSTCSLCSQPHSQRTTLHWARELPQESPLGSASRGRDSSFFFFNRLPAQRRAQCEAWTHKPEMMTWGKSWTLKWLSSPGGPKEGEVWGDLLTVQHWGEDLGVPRFFPSLLLGVCLRRQLQFLSLSRAPWQEPAVFWSSPTLKAFSLLQLSFVSWVHHYSTFQLAKC